MFLAIRLTSVTLAGLTASPYVWTPVASESVRPNQLYTLSIEQSGLTNYSPMFAIGGAAAAPAALDRMYAAYGVPLPVGTQHYFPLYKRGAPEAAKVHHSELQLFSGGIIPRSFAINAGAAHTAISTGTGPVTPLAYATGYVPQLAYATGSGTGTGIRGGFAQTTPSSVQPYLSAASMLNVDWRAVMTLFLLLLWI